MDPITLGGQTHQCSPPIHPIRYRLHRVLASTDDATDTFAILCAVLGVCCPSITGMTAVQARDAVRQNAVDFGEVVMDAALSNGVSMNDLSDAALACSKEVFGLAPSEEEIESSVNFTEDQTGDSTNSTSVVV